MLSRHLRIAASAGLLLAGLAVVGCEGGSSPFNRETAKIFFETATIPAGGAGQLYNAQIRFGSEGQAALPDRFELSGGTLPPGVRLMPDREDLNLDGIPDEDGALTGHARLIGFPRTKGSYTFRLKAISTGALGTNPEQPAVSTFQDFALAVGEGSVTILTPTAQEGTSDSAVPAFPVSLDFVSPANPQGFFSWAFLVAGGSGSNILNVYLPRELELSSFDANVVDGIDALDFDTDESLGSGNKFIPFFTDGGWFVLQAGNGKVQVGGFQAPRGPVGTIIESGSGPGLDPDWFQRTGVAVNSRRNLGDSEGLAGGDDTLGTPLPVQFSDYFDPMFEATWPDGPTPPVRKYPFRALEYSNAFFLSFTPGVDLTPLRFRAIVEAIDTRGTLNRSDDVIDRKSYAVNVRIPDIKIDTVLLPDGRAGVEYTEFVTASGGVPPLSFDLEWVDGVPDYKATAGSALVKQDFGIELGHSRGQFIGIPRAQGTVDLTVCVYADVMNPTQSGPSYAPTGTEGEYAGLHPLTGNVGVHKTFRVQILPPNPPVLVNTSLAPGIDGFGYPGDRLIGAGGVPLLVPYPVGFQGTYPSSTARHAYGWDASYTRDQSWGADAGTTDPDRPLPNNLKLDGDILSTNNGQISGIPYDRGFHTVTIIQSDAFLGSATNPDVDLNHQVATTELALSVSPDSAAYMRGDQNTGGEKTGLLEPSTSMGQAEMIPMFEKGGIYLNVTGEGIKTIPGMPTTIDFLPLGIANGGSDEDLDKTTASVAGFWPAESNKNDRWEYYYYGYASPYRGWKHVQQEVAWIQTPTDQHYRVFLWAQTKLKKYEGPWGSSYGSSYANNSKYGIVDRSSGKKRGVFILNPLTGEFWIPAILTNSDKSHGAQFGTEDCLGTSSYGITDSSYSDTYAYYWCYVYGGSYNCYYSYMFYGNEDGREARLGGVGAFFETYANASQGPKPEGQCTTSVAVSADGLWSATALIGATSSRILLWRNDKQPIPAAMLSQGHITGLDGLDSKGNTLKNTACIVDVGAYGSDPRYLLPDSLMFVRDGVLFLMERRLDYVNGFSLVDGHLSTRSVNSRTALSGTQGVSPYFAPSTTGQPVPDQDFKLGMKRVMHSSVQFSFKGSKPLDGEEGPDKVAFIAGPLYNVRSPMDAYSVINNQGNSPYYKLSDDAVRKGMSQGVIGYKSVLFLQMPVAANGLDLGSGGTVIKDLSGQDSNVYGDYLTPGRLGEELDFLDVSPDGKYVAAVRNVADGNGVYSYIYYSYVPTFGSVSTTTNTTTNYYQSSDDIVLFSTEGKDLDTASGTQTVLFLGTGVMGPSSSSKSSAYSSGGAYITSYARRIEGVTFSPDSKSVIFVMQSHTSYNPKYMGSAYQYCINASSRSTTYDAACARISIRWEFRTSSDGPITFGSSPGNFLSNNLANLSGVGATGVSSPPFSDVGGIQQFWTTFKSPNGDFLYYISDGTSGRNHMVGINIGATTINGHAPWEPFSTHGSSIGFEQFDCCSWNYEGRFAAVPAGVKALQSGRDGAGIVFVIGSDAASGATSPTDLEVYAFDSNLGGDLVSLTGAVTDGTQNAINHLFVSTDGNSLIGQRTKTSDDSGDTRSRINNQNDLFCVTNVHAALNGATPNAFMLSVNQSHGSSVAFVGDGTSTGPAAVVYSSATASTSNTSWATRTLKIVPMAPGATPVVLDSTASHYVVLSGGRKLDDDPFTSN